MRPLFTFYSFTFSLRADAVAFVVCFHFVKKNMSVRTRTVVGIHRRVTDRATSRGRRNRPETIKKKCPVAPISSISPTSVLCACLARRGYPGGRAVNAMPRMHHLFRLRCHRRRRYTPRDDRAMATMRIRCHRRRRMRGGNQRRRAWRW